MAHIPYPDLASISPEAREMLGRLPAPANIFNMMAHAETCLKPVMKLGGTLLGKLELDARLRELCLLQAVKVAGGEYEWLQHVPIALDLGVTEAQIAALEQGDDRAACFDACEQAALVFTRQLVAGRKASPAALAALRVHLSDREVVELTLMAGFYCMLAGLTETLAVENDPPIGSSLVRGIEARVKAKRS
ncbi:MAG: carboxymuconolactone decarboxylase family protein [Hyphomicrobiaceae bacterium]|nr:carboxymuconolactone decarboxylase family protein [Hyphomicrobiaceae bacterium]